jgi:hypothetical protein
MIANEREYQTTKAAIRRLKQALAHADERSAERHPLLQQALREGIEGELQLLGEQLAEYEARRVRRHTPTP